MEEMPWYVSLIASWLPLLAFLGAVLWAGRRIGRELKTPDGRSLALVVDEYGKELRRSNDMLERLLIDYQQRLETIEHQR